MIKDAATFYFNEKIRSQSSRGRIYGNDDRVILLPGAKFELMGKLALYEQLL